MLGQRTTINKQLLLLYFILSACSAPMEEEETIDLPFSGTWINKNYYQKLIDTKSPQHAQLYIWTGIANIPPQNNKKISLFIQLHEGRDFKLKKEGETYSFYQYYTEEKDKDGWSIEVLQEDSILQIGNDTMLKFSDIYEDRHVLEKVLFAGTYSYGDSSVHFSEDGKVTGLPGFAIYQVVIDYFYVGMQVDQIFLGESPHERRERIAFEFRGDTLQLFDLNCLEYNKDYQYCMVVEKGDPLYTLIKQN